MKILFLTNNFDVTKPLYEYLCKKFNTILYKDKPNLETFKRLEPDIIISYNYRYIIKKDIIETYKNRILNLHISYLPWNRGAYPNVWSFIENTPKGVTIHLIDEGIDTGDILIQKEIFIDEEKHTLKSSYMLLQREIQKLFIENLDKILNFKLKPKPQNKNEGSYHSLEDFRKYVKPVIDKYGWDIKIKDFLKLVTYP